MSEQQFTTEQIATHLSTAFDSSFEAVAWRRFDTTLAESCVEIAPVLSLNRPDDVEVVGIYLTGGQRFKVIVEEVKPAQPATAVARYLGDNR